MEEPLTKIIVIFLFLFAGKFLQLFGTITRKTGEDILKIVYNFTLPTLILSLFSSIELTQSDFVFPFLASMVFILTLAAGYLISVRIKNKLTRGSFILTTIIMNTGFCLPFVLAFFGDKGMALLLLFDIGNSLLIFSVGYLVAAYFSENRKRNIIYKLFLSPPFMAMLIAIFLNYSNIQLGSVLKISLKTIGGSTIPLTLLAMGILFQPGRYLLKWISATIVLRMILGGMIGLALSKLIGMSDFEILLCTIFSAAPCGYNSIVFSSIEKLDVAFAGNAVSYSLLLSSIGFLLYSIFYRIRTPNRYLKIKKNEIFLFERIKSRKITLKE